MSSIIPALQLIVAIGLLNVWLFRFNTRTAYRGGSAGTMPEEFAAYGLPAAAVYVVGGLKVGVALAMVAGLWFPVVVVPAAALLAALMLGAIAMHIRIQDPPRKSLPALLMLALAITIAIAAPR